MTTGNSSLALSGLASGIDWQSLVTQLVQAERAPETQMTAQKTKFQQQNNAYTSIQTQLGTLNSDVNTLLNPSLFNSRQTTLSNAAVASATAADGTALGNYTFNITQLASDAVQLGTTATGKALSATNDVSSLVLASAGFANPVSAGTFTVNGRAITIATTDTLQSVFDQISTATGGAVTGAYDASTDKISLSSGSPIVLGSATDSSNFLQTAKLYNNGGGAVTSASALGGVNLNNGLASANLATTISDGGAGAGSFLINGVQISFNASTDNVNNVLARINNSAAGVTATYDTVNNRFELTNKTTGDVGIALQDVTGNFLATTGLSTGTLQRGANLLYKINGGGTLTSQSNLITQDSSGLTGLSVSALALGSTTVGVSSDTSKISSAITSFVTDYNAVQNYISSQTATAADSSGNVTAGVLTGDSEAEGIATTLRRMVNATPGLSGAIKNLGGLGIVSNGNDNTLAISNVTTLNTALTNNLDAVKNLFADSTAGLATTLGAYLKNATGDSGALATKEAHLTQQSKDIDTSIAAMERKILDDQQRLNDEFAAMETAVSAINQQKQYLTATFGGGTTGTSATNSASSSASGL